AAVAQRESDEPSQIGVYAAASNIAVFAPGPIGVWPFGAENHIAGAEFIGARLLHGGSSQHHERMPAAGLDFDFLAPGYQELIFGGNVEFPNVCDLAQSSLASRRVHRGGLNVEIADVVGPAIAIQHARAAVGGRAIEENFYRLKTAKSRPNSGVRRD